MKSVIVYYKHFSGPKTINHCHQTRSKINKKIKNPLVNNFSIKIWNQLSIKTTWALD